MVIVWPEVRPRSDRGGQQAEQSSVADLILNVSMSVILRSWCTVAVGFERLRY